MTSERNRTAELLRVCGRHVLGSEFDVVVPEPYIPHVPAMWNGTLVLAEAQNLSNTYRDYREDLLGWSSKERMTRLGRRENLDVHPWDDGWLKLAAHVAFALNPLETAVSNAVLWSQVTAKGANRPPSMGSQQRSAEVWAGLLRVLRPRHIITAGNKACYVLSQVSAGSRPPWRHTALVFPAPPNISGWLRKYDVRSLLVAYPEVERAQREHRDWFAGNASHKILFACHAVSEFERPARMASISLDRCPPSIRLDRIGSNEGP